MFKSQKIIIQALGLILIIGFAFYLAHLASENETIKELVASYGYAGIFIVSLVSGFNILVPLPAASLMPLFIQAGLSFLPTVLLITLGMTAADAISFYLARTSKRLVSESFGDKLLEKFCNIPLKYRRYPLAILFIFASVVPLPNEVLLIPMAFLFSYRFFELIPIVLAGNFVFNILLSKGLLNLFQSLY